MLRALLRTAMCATILAVALAPARPTPPPRDFVLPQELICVKAGVRPLQPDTAMVRTEGGGEERPIQLAVHWKYYNAKWVRAYDGRAETIQQRIQCFALVPTGATPSEPYAWAIWWHDAPGVPSWFWLLQHDGSESHLLFSDGPGLYLADVAQARDPLVAFHEDMGPGPPKAYGRIPTALLGEKMVAMGGEYSWSLNEPWVEPTSLSRNEQGELVLGVRYTHNGFRGRLVKRADDWVLLDVQQEPPQQQERAGTVEQKEAPAHP